MDLSIDPLLPDVHHFHDNVGSRAQCMLPTRGGNDDKSTDWGMTGESHSRLRPQPKEPVDLRSRLGKLPEADRLLIIARMKGIKLAPIAKELGVSVATVWRREKAAIARIRSHHEGNVDHRST
jgi:DNA-directed RNA polymerase specialized sigma24 family protein